MGSGVSSKDLIKFLGSLGFQFVHQRGSHIILRRSSDNRRVSVPRRKEVGIGLFLAILAQVGSSKEEFNQWNSR